MQNAISWFEIPVLNLATAQQFYETVLQCSMRRENMGPSEGAIFPYDNAAGGVGGALMCGPTAPITATGAGGDGSGVLVYLDGSPHAIDSLLQRAVSAGGRVAMPRTALPPGMGFIACIYDLDGNKVGLHAMD
ncbi:MAG: VOC family protein [Burkholderiaceae bacterium]